MPLVRLASLLTILLLPVPLYAQAVGAGSIAAEKGGPPLHYRVKERGVHLRATPDAKGKSLARLSQGDLVELVAASKDQKWLQVRRGTRAGHVLAASVEEVVLSPEERAARAVVESVTRALNWRAKEFWLLLAALAGPSLLLSFLNRRLDRVLHRRNGEHLDYRFHTLSCGAVGLLGGALFLLWDVEVVRYVQGFGFRTPLWSGALEFLLFASAVYLALLTLVYLARDLSSTGLVLGPVHHLANLMAGLAWAATAWCAAVGVLVPALLLFGGLAYLRIVLSPSHWLSDSSTSTEQRPSGSDQAAALRAEQQARVARGVQEDHDMRSRGYEKGALGLGWKKKDE